MTTVEITCKCECHQPNWAGKKHYGYEIENCPCKLPLPEHNMTTVGNKIKKIIKPKVPEKIDDSYGAWTSPNFVEKINAIIEYLKYIDKYKL